MAPDLEKKFHQHRIDFNQDEVKTAFLNIVKVSRSRVGTRPNRWHKMSQQVFQQIPAPFGPLIPKLCSAKSEIEGKWILMNPGSSLADYQLLEDCQPIRNQDSFPSKSDLAENSLRINGPNGARISWKTGWDISCNLFGLVTTRGEHCIWNIKYFMNRMLIFQKKQT